MADATTSTSSDPSVLSDLGTIGKSALDFIGSPAGGQVITGAEGMYQAGQANKQIAGLYKPVQQTGGQFTQAGQQTLGAVQPSLTASIPGQTQFATQQQQVAQQYGTGQLTPAQQQQVNSYVQQQKSMALAELSKAGITDPNSRQMQTRMADIQDNAMSMAQGLVQGNQQIATGAENAVQGVYNNILAQALRTAGLGTDAQLAAARGIIQGDTQISDSLQTLLKGISGLLSTAQPAAGQPGQQPGGGVAAGQAGGGTNVAQSAVGRAAGAIGDIGTHLGLGNYTYNSPYAAYSASAPGNQLATPDLTMPTGSLTSMGTDTGAVTPQAPAALDPYGSMSGGGAPTFSGFDIGSFDTAPSPDMTG